MTYKFKSALILIFLVEGTDYLIMIGSAPFPAGQDCGALLLPMKEKFIPVAFLSKQDVKNAFLRGRLKTPEICWVYGLIVLFCANGETPPKPLNASHVIIIKITAGEVVKYKRI